MFGMQGKIYLIVFGFVGSVAAFSALDRGMNYIETAAIVTSVEIDCFIKFGKKSVVEKKTGNLAYMKCELAPLVAKKYGHLDSAVQKRAKIQYGYESPVDNNYYTGEIIRKHSVEKFVPGYEFAIYAHDEEPGTSLYR